MNLPTSSSPASTAEVSPDYSRPLAMVTTLFFMWGFLTSLNDILIPHFKNVFDLNYTQVLLIQFVFFSAYFVFSLPSGKFVEWFGFKGTMVAGLLVAGLGALLFIPAASIPSYPLFLTAFVVLAAGITALQVSANPYVTVLGPARTSSSRLNLTQAFNSLGTTVGPLLGSYLILKSVPKTPEEMHAMLPQALSAYRLEEASSVKLPYLGFGLALILLAAVIAKAKLPAIAPPEDAETRAAAAAGHDSVWRHRHLVLGAVAIFTYVGAEVAIGSLLISYISQHDIGDLTVRNAAYYVAFYWGGAMVGRFIGAGVLQKIRTGTVLGFAAFMAAVLVVTSMLTFGHFAMWTILLVGLFNSIMFPSIFALGVDGLGPLTGKGSSLLIAAIVGGAIIPELQGVLTDRIGLHHAFILPALCYVYIGYYALIGSKKVVHGALVNPAT